VTPPPKYPDKPLSSRQYELFLFIKRFLEARGYPPSHHDMTKGIAVGSTNSTMGLLRQLEAKGYLDITPNIARGIVLTGKEP
jgi:repressor LexA